MQSNPQEKPLDALQPDQHERILRFLQAELGKIPRAINEFEKIGIAEVAGELKQRQQATSELLFKIQEMSYVQRYQRLYKEVELLKQTEEYSELDKTLTEMATLTAQHLEVARLAGRSQDVDKYSSLLREIRDNLEYNARFRLYKECEQAYNAIVEILRKGQYNEARVKTEKTATDIQHLISTVQVQLQKNPGLTRVREKTVKLQLLLQQLQEEIKRGYVQLAKGGTAPPIVLSPVEATLTAPQLQSFNIDEETRHFIHLLDQQFKGWHEQGKKKGKLEDLSFHHI